MSRSREVLNKNFESIASNFSGAIFPSVNLVPFMTCYRTDQKKLYRLQEDLLTWKLEVDYSSGFPVVNGSINSDVAKKANELTAEYVSKIEVSSDSEGIIVTSIENGVATKRDVNLKPKYAELLDFFYPVGHILVTASSLNPAEKMGGVWKQIPEGTFLVAAGTSTKYRQGVTGGEAEHVLKVDEMPSHNHGGATSNSGEHSHTANSAGDHYHGSGWGERNTYGSNYGIYDSNNNHVGSGDTDNDNAIHRTSTNGAHTHTTTTNGAHTHTIQSDGGGKAHNNLPPYIAMYMWQRIA